eukprot:scaffold16156_cov68-Phaeocystis_antarctica.AAC.3
MPWVVGGLSAPVGPPRRPSAGSREKIRAYDRAKLLEELDHAAPGHATARSLAQQHVPGNICHFVYIQGVTGGTCCAPSSVNRNRSSIGQRQERAEVPERSRARALVATCATAQEPGANRSRFFHCR